MQENLMTELLSKAIDNTSEVAFNSKAEEIHDHVFNNSREESVISSISFIGSIEGTCTISLPDSSACTLVSRMLDMELTEVTADVLDGIGEFVNMIIGSIKVLAQEYDQNFEISIPTFIKGSRMVILRDLKNTLNINKSFLIDDSISFAVHITYRIKETAQQVANKKQAVFDKLKNLG